MVGSLYCGTAAYHPGYSIPIRNYKGVSRVGAHSDSGDRMTCYGNPYPIFAYPQIYLDFPLHGIAGSLSIPLGRS